MMKCLVRVVVGLWLVAASSWVASSAQNSSRERIPLDDGWRFVKGDPPGIDSSTLLYDVRPAFRGEDQKERAAGATEEGARLAKPAGSVLKPWILPTGDAFLKDPAKAHARPAGEPPVMPAYVRADFDDSAWTKVNLPHDWAIAGPFNSGGVGGSMGRLPSPGIGWYRRQLTIPASDAGRSVFLEIDGAMSYAAVWLNGKLVGGWPYGYASWQVDLTRYLVPGGRNQLAIRLDNPPDSSRWYPGAGLYRHVRLLKTSPLHVAQWGRDVTSSGISTASAEIRLETTLDNDSSHASEIDVLSTIFALDGEDNASGAAVASIAANNVVVPAHSHVQAAGTALLRHPALWGPAPAQKPNRYVAITRVVEHGREVDRYETRFGIRQIEYKPDGLYVNGLRVRIQGVNQHHDLGALGAAFNRRAAERQLEELQAMGCNAIRMAHNPPAPELLELTDRAGILVLDEIFDGWLRQKTPFDFHLIFADWHEQDLRAFVRRDRNHPSVFLWSVGNEVGEQTTGAAGASVARELVAIVHEEDPTRGVTASMNSAAPGSLFADAVDVIALNYQGEGIRDTPEYAGFPGLKKPPQYDAFRRAYPGRLILSSESAAALSSRGTYLFPVAKGISNPVQDGLGGDDKREQVSAYELYAANFGSSADKVFAVQDRHPYVGGEFVWSGWDYLGEPTPYYGARSSYFGVIDLAGFPKDRFYLYQSRWRPDLAMAHILPHWTWPDRVGMVTSVHVFTSGDEAELFLNGRSLGRKRRGPLEYRMRWDDVIYQPGTLRVVSYRNGAEWASDEVTTAGDATKLKVETDRTHIAADGSDLAFVSVTLTDERGVTQPLSDAPLRFRVEGPGEIVATDNGDPTDMQAFPSHGRKAFHGKCLVIVRSIAGAAGSIRVHAESSGLKAAEVTISAEGRGTGIR